MVMAATRSPRMVMDQSRTRTPLTYTVKTTQRLMSAGIMLSCVARMRCRHVHPLRQETGNKALLLRTLCRQSTCV